MGSEQIMSFTLTWIKVKTSFFPGQTSVLLTQTNLWHIFFSTLWLFCLKEKKSQFYFKNLCHTPLTFIFLAWIVCFWKKGRRLRKLIDKPAKFLIQLPNLPLFFQIHFSNFCLLPSAEATPSSLEHCFVQPPSNKSNSTVSSEWESRKKGNQHQCNCHQYRRPGDRWATSGSRFVCHLSCPRASLYN